MRRRGNKYGNEKVYWDGMVFDSIKEYQRWIQLKMFERPGEITGLSRQVPFVLIPSQKKDVDNGYMRTEYPTKYIADFVYTDKSGRMVVEDAKGHPTPDYVIKRKLMRQVHGIEIVEV